MRIFLLITVVCLSGPAFGQLFECRIGQDAACLDWGDTVCSSQGMCVDKNAVCFESYQCDYKGFACRSEVVECVEAHDSIARDYNALLADYESLRAAGEALTASNETLDRELEELKNCLIFASTIEDAQLCAY